MNLDSKIYIAGHRGLAGSAITRELQRQGYTNIVGRTHAELDLEDAVATRKFFEQEHPEIVFLAAAKVGGIHANNSYPVDFLMSNLLIEANICRAAYAINVIRALQRTGEEYGRPLKVLEAVESVNNAQKSILLHKIAKRFGNNLAGKRFALWGLAFKPD